MAHAPVRLVTLSPEFLRYGLSPARVVLWTTVNRVEAQGVSFLCPKCFSDLGKVGTHRVVVWDPTVPADARPAPGRWTLHGKDFDDLTLGPASPATALEAGCGWRGFLRAGVVTDAEA